MADSTKGAARGGRPRRGSLYWTKSGWRARLTIEVDGEAVQKSFDLETTDRAVARIKLRRLAKQYASPVEQLEEDAARVETFEEAAERIVDESTIRTKDARLARLKLHVFPALASKPVTEIVAGDVREVLKELADAGASKQQCIHVRNDISAVLGDLWRADMLPDNVAARGKVRIPKNAKVDKRERSVLTDNELLHYLAWQHPVETKRPAVLERQTMAATSRVFGGLRWGDIRALRWENFETTGGRFSKGWAPRKKSARPQALEVPEMLRPILRDWWERQGRKTTGLVFPARRGARAGEERKPSSIAKVLRRDLRRAFGIEAPAAVDLIRSNQRKDYRLTWQDIRPLTDRERELLVETEFTRPVDFHSFRRQFKQGLADANVDVQRSMALSGATDLSAHRRYLTNTGKLGIIPVAALPSFSMGDAETLAAANDPLPENPANSAISSCRRSDLNRRPHAYETTRSDRSQWFSMGPDGRPIAKPADLVAPCRNSMLKLPAWSRLAADAAIAAYLGSMACSLADRLVN